MPVDSPTLPGSNEVGGATVRVLSWDSSFFGVTMAQIEGPFTRLHENAVFKQARAKGVRFLQFFCDGSDLEGVAAAEAGGFSLVDARMTFELQNLNRRDIPGHARFRVGRGQPEDIPSLSSIAGRAHLDSRFYVDGRFPVDRIDSLFETWVVRAIHGTFDDFALVLYQEHKALGYCSLKLRSGGQSAQIGLFGIAAEYRGKALGRYLLETSLQMLTEMGVNEVEVVTQGRNITAQRLYQRAGFLTRRMEFIYHKWI